MFAPASNIYPRDFGHSYDHYIRPNTLPVNSRSSFFDSLAETRLVESEILAQEAAWREEEALERRLKELRQAHLTPQSYSYDVAPYQPRLHGLSNQALHMPSDSLLETLRLEVAEQEQLAKLEALRQRRRQLEAEERLKAAAELRRRKSEVEELARREQTRRLRELAIAEEEDRLRRLIQRQRVAKLPQVVNALHRHQLELPPKPVSLPVQRNSHSIPHDVLELIIELTTDASAGKPGVSNTSSLPKKTHPAEPATASQAIDLASVLQQLGLSPATDDPRPSLVKKEEKRPNQQPIPLTSSRQFGSSMKASPSHGIKESASISDFGDLWNLLASSPQVKQEEKKPSASPKAPVAATLEVTLKEELEKRLEGTYANELRDTVLAVLNSLGDVQPATTTASQSSTPRSSSIPSSSPTVSDKGKGRAYASAGLPLPSTRDVKGVMDRVREIESRFHMLENEFEFPAKLDFTSTSSLMSSPAPIASQLAYTATNQPVRYYEQALSNLLAQLDSVESNGSEELRNRRKVVVRKVENALEDLEQRVEARWKASMKESKRRSVTIEDVTTPDEHLMIPENVPALENAQSPQAPQSAPVTHQTEQSAATVEETTPAAVKEADEPHISVPESNIVENSEETTETAHPDQPIPEQDSVSERNDSEEAPVFAPAEVLPEVPDSPDDAHSEDVLAEERMVTPTVQHLASPPETSVVQVPAPFQLTDPEDVIHVSACDHPVTVSPLESSHTPAIRLQDDVSESQPDLSATIRPFIHITPEERSSNPAALDSSESEMSETEAEGLLLDNGVVEAAHEMSDTESTSSDWSEVDAASH